MTNIQNTSILAYLNNVKPNLSARQKSILETIEVIEPYTNKEIAKYLKWEINSVTPRVLELRKKRVVKQYSTTTADGRKAIQWSTADYASY